jgi:3,4-dihydroxy 2-butanone 4-phosphate synthase / GTP cyclohydrolase II
MTQRTPWSATQETLLRSVHGTFRLRAYEFPGGAEHSALLVGAPHRARRPLVRVQSSCLTGTAFGAVLCDCRPQLEESMRRVVVEDEGCVLYLAQEGRGHGLVEKVRQLSLITSGLATTATAAGNGRVVDLRTYESAFAILDDVLDGRRTIRLLTNNPTKIAAFQAVGYTVDRMPLEMPPTDDNRAYLHVKKHDLGHLLTSV